MPVLQTHAVVLVMRRGTPTRTPAENHCRPPWSMSMSIVGCRWRMCYGMQWPPRCKRQTDEWKKIIQFVCPSLTPPSLASLSVCLPQACLWLQTACRRTDACSHHTLEVVVVEVLTASAAIRFDRFNPRTRGKVSSSIPSVWKGKAKCGYTAMGRCWEAYPSNPCFRGTMDFSLLSSLQPSRRRRSSAGGGSADNIECHHYIEQIFVTNAGVELQFRH